MISRLPFKLLLLGFLLAPVLALAENRHAVLVGVSEYPNLDPSLNLVGPANDVQRVRIMLQQQGFADNQIRVLADQVSGAELPTKANIVSAISDVEKAAQSGDFVYLHFSGHGSQQPASDTEQELDGLDEIFLPRDVTQWSRQLGAVPNAISDDEIASMVGGLRAKGANVWLVFDSCHSGTMTRSVADAEVRMRKVAPGSLGLPPAPEAGKGSGPVQVFSDMGNDNNGTGDLIAFFAAQSSEEAPEMALDNGDGTRVAQGLFTHTLTSLIGANPNISYRQLAQLALGSYNSLPWHRTTPLFEGTGLDTPIFHRDGDVAVRHPARGDSSPLTLQAGQLNGYDKGALVALYASADAEEPVAAAEVVSASLTSAQLEVRDGELDGRTHFAEVTRPAFPPPLRVKWLMQPERKAWQQATNEIQADKGLLSRTLEWVGADEAADISLYANDQRLYLFTADNELPCSLGDELSLPCTEKPQSIRSVAYDKAQVAPTLSASLVKMVRAINLMRLSDSLHGSAGLETEVQIKPANADAFAPWQPGSGLVMRDGDELRAEFMNRGRRPLDVTILFIDSGMGITQIFPEPGTSGRLLSGEATDFEGVVNASTLGAEQLMIIATPVSRHSPPTSLAHLQQSSLESAVFSRSVRAGESGDDLFAQALGDAPRSRGFGKKSSGSSDNAAISVIRWQTQPAE